MEGLLKIAAILSLSFFKHVQCGIVPLPELTPALCNLTVWRGNSDVTHQRINVLEGDTINLVCDARCTNEHYTPALKWINPQQMIVWDVPGRLFTAPMNSHRLQSLYIQDISDEDIGIYHCWGWTGRWTDATVDINIETQQKKGG